MLALVPPHGTSTTVWFFFRRVKALAARQLASPVIPATVLRAWPWLLGALLASCQLTPAWAQAPQVAYRAPLEIKRGGTYSGNFRSLDARVPCIKIRTHEPVILENCILAGAGALILADSTRHDITVRHCRGYGLVTGNETQPRGRFLDVVQARSIRVEHNYMENTAGIYLYQWSGDGSAANTLTVVANDARNLDGRFRSQYDFVSFLQLNQVHALAGADIAWNRVVNLPTESLVEDNLNFFNSGGTAQSPVRVHDNYIYGSFGVGDLSQVDHTGTGINCDGDATTPADATQYIEANDNVIVATTNAGMNIASGHHLTYRNNLIVSAAQAVVNGQPVPVKAAFAGMSVFSYYQQPFFGNHTVEGNTIGYLNGSSRQRKDISDPSPYQANPALQTALPDPITRATEEEAYQQWLRRVERSGVTLGPAGLRVPENPPATTAGLAYQYYEGFWDTLPSFGGLSATQSGITPDLNLSTVARRDYGYAVQYTGYLTVPTDGQYTFATTSDDGSRLYIGSQLVVDNDGLHASQQRSGTIGLRAGTHALTVAFFQNGGGQQLEVRYQVPGQTLQVVPASAFRRPAATTSTVLHRINAGGGDLTTSWGPFAADQYANVGSSYVTSQPIAGTSDDALYQSEHNGNFRYSFPVANGSYTVVLHFAEIYWSQPGQRVFDVALEGVTRLDDYDIVARVGPLTATTETLPVTVTDGWLDIDFQARVDLAKVSAIEVLSTAGSNRALGQPLAQATSNRAQVLQTYPNPAHTTLLLTCSAVGSGSATLTLATTQGRIVRRQTLVLQAGANQLTLPVEGIASGLYLLTLVEPGRPAQHQKVLIQH
ncbi:malectin domain-containing carbohydrate-binding protein [Hymenobacter sp. YC55]|uniref:malectin domain-containing carbohydrate-binding protein n=1 Tax=Hymenobacter sp. YC55 TaxID=3034019 RepID=UPI0023F9CCF4|nr:malectin domain-containing carbohydrate-binding protein [Hymenobacter sp. YC55]MDF7815204.1 malectin domain-containing carbohydrate-binding protein [Hymenobacter sp. YC55]